MARTRLLALALLWTGAAAAQDASLDPLSSCPQPPQDSIPAIRWEPMRTGDMLFCRAVLADSGEEAFALTISRESPFRPRRADRAEVSNVGGREIQWYRGEVANDPALQVRETLLQLSGDRVVHVFMRSRDPEALARYQQLVLSLPLPIRIED
jgi:hypothetical protein